MLVYNGEKTLFLKNNKKTSSAEHTSETGRTPVPWAKSLLQWANKTFHRFGKKREKGRAVGSRTVGAALTAAPDSLLAAAVPPLCIAPARYPPAAGWCPKPSPPSPFLADRDDISVPSYL